MIENVIEILPMDISNVVNKISNKENITEIRLRVGTFLKIYFGKKEKDYNVVINKLHLTKILSNISTNSIYSVQNDINKGFITIKGGNRIGIAGEVVMVEGKIKNIKEISSMNIRVSNEHIGAANNVINSIITEGKINNTLIVSPPGMGKTTLIRDIIRILSDSGYNITLIDERGEIAAMYDGVPSLNVGNRTDVISFVDKAYGMQMAVRSLKPDVVCTDEIGDSEDIEAIKYLCKCGVSFITTMHGETFYDVEYSGMKEIIESRILGYNNYSF